MCAYAVCAVISDIYMNGLLDPEDEGITIL